MEILLSVGLFAVAMLGMSVGVLFKGQDLRGSCGGGEVHDEQGESMSCGACPKAEKELCPSDDPLVLLAQIGHPNPIDHR